MMHLYTYFRSSAAYRVRIALNLKALPYEAIPLHLLKNGGEQLQPAYRAINPSGLVPALDHGGAIITQSLAMLEYLEEVYPQPALLPTDPAGRARVRVLAQTVACDIHPIGNLRVLKYLTGTLGVSDEAKLEWSRHWIREGFAALETMLATSKDTGSFCHGDRPTIADCCLVPQVSNAVRFGVDLTPYPTIVAIDAACAELPAFIAAHPSRQPDAE
jgi:maleylpyruvate isomerase